MSSFCINLFVDIITVFTDLVCAGISRGDCLTADFGGILVLVVLKFSLYRYSLTYRCKSYNGDISNRAELSIMY